LIGEDKEKKWGCTMKSATLGFMFLTAMMITTPCMAFSAYLGTTISEYDVLGCQQKTNNPRCKKVVKVACKTICHGHWEESTDFGTACREMCELPLKDKKEDKEESLPNNQ
jgi:hypothetical protein